MQLNLDLDGFFSAFVMGGLRFDATFQAACEANGATASPYGCACYWDPVGHPHSCACCAEGDYCGCGQSMPHMCTTCGNTDGCELGGMVRTASSHRALALSQQLIASPSKEVHDDAQQGAGCDFNATCSLSVVAKAGVALTFPNPFKIAVDMIEDMTHRSLQHSTLPCATNPRPTLCTRASRTSTTLWTS